MVCMHLSLHSKQAMYKNIRQPQHRKGHKMIANNQSKDNVRNETTHVFFNCMYQKKIVICTMETPTRMHTYEIHCRFVNFQRNVPISLRVATIASCAKS
jgi:hypothetical protein